MRYPICSRPPWAWRWDNAPVTHAARLLVGLTTLSLLAEAAEERPLLCLVDDAQWLDEASAQTLAFVARRVEAERLALLFALRDPGPVPEGPEAFAGLPELRLGGLGEADARALLAAAVHAPLDEGVRDRIIAEARGNPLALLELPRGAEPAHLAELAGGFGLPDALSVPRRIEDSFQRRSGSLPASRRSRCCWSRRPNRSATPRCCGERPSTLASAPRLPHRR